MVCSRAVIVSKFGAVSSTLHLADNNFWCQSGNIKKHWIFAYFSSVRHVILAADSDCFLMQH